MLNVCRQGMVRRRWGDDILTILTILTILHNIRLHILHNLSIITTMGRETQLQNQIRLSCSNGSTRLFRNNVGLAYTSTGQPIKFGLCKGSSDLIGWQTKTITPDMVGKQIAVFTALEVKTDTGKPSKQQSAFINAVRQAGGIAGIVRSIEDTNGLLQQ